MTNRELETLHQHILKAAPPEKAYRYRKPGDWAIKEISDPHLHVASPNDMNDPFEYLAPVHFDLAKVKTAYIKHCIERGYSQGQAIREAADLGPEQAEKLRTSLIDFTRKHSGLICLSSNPRSIRMWAYYAECHKGICITYDTEAPPFCLARPVLYEDPTTPLDAMDAHSGDLTQFADHIALRKGKEWEFEKEYRIPIGPIEDHQTRTLAIRPEAILEIRLGVNIEPAFEKEVRIAAAKLSNPPVIIQMVCDTNKFILLDSPS